LIHFVKLRLSGFKSFVDNTELAIAPGITGVVGPNGCGKSNLVEALRWVMGETSAKQMRGGEMDDVIFGGTASRPSRNVAEVTVVIDNAERSAPAIFNSIDEIEIARRIERGTGSLYKVNGKEVRARDVALLFADAATGARSTAMVSQGRIGALINARPSDRRALLEEAAGISGLHSRRHEAELRLRAAEQNLTRLDDVLTTLDQMVQSLRKQAKQAQRYRVIAEQIRAAEAQLLALRWLEAVTAHTEARSGLMEAEGRVAERTARATEAAAIQVESASALPALRQEEAEAGARHQRLVVAREQLDAQETRAAQEALQARQLLAQSDADLGRERARREDAAQALARLEDEQKAIRAAQDGELPAQTEAKKRLALAQDSLDAAEGLLTQLTQQVAEADAQRQETSRRLSEAALRRQKASERAQLARAQLAAAEADSIDPILIEEALQRRETATEALETARLDMERAEQGRQDASRNRDAARDKVQEAAAARATLRAEEAGLVALLAKGKTSTSPPLLDLLSVRPGYEKALAAALGEDMSHPVDDPDADSAWSSLPAMSEFHALPAGAEQLQAFVQAPAALTRRLCQVGIVRDRSVGAALRHDLAPGQRLVTRDGDFWRWDGLETRAGAPSPAAIRLEQRNRLIELREQIGEAEALVAHAEAAYETAAKALEDSQAAERNAREAVKAAEAAATSARDAYERLSRQAAAAELLLAGRREAADRASGDLAEAEAIEEEARMAADTLPDSAASRDRQAALRAELAERRTHLVEIRSTLDRLIREAGDRTRRLAALDGEIRAWTERAGNADIQIAALAERRETVLAEIERLAGLPMEIASHREGLLDQIQEARLAYEAASERRAQAERVQGEIDKVLRDAERALAEAREQRIRREAAVEAASEACRNVAGRIAEKLDMTPEQLTGSVETEAAPPPADLERKVDRLLRERESIGAVNLRADQELAEQEAEWTTLTREREDLTAAIAKLRRGISEINREARERLNSSFEAVDRHFRELFVRLFGGGRAHLTLTEPEDPLAAGLEIMASPPGKRLQSLSLLSGGEQALTAIALLFAVFLTNPAPICVLDEVDAPLDDANVDRFCTLVEEIAHSSRTRFLIITHHRMTMARMDRLFGVTMSERGISQLVSVDLRRAAELVEPA
jgi:chromosome segregation protein